MLCEYVQFRPSYCRLSEFSIWRPPPSWISWKWNLTSQEVAGCWYLPPDQIWWKYLKRRPSYGSLCVFKMAAAAILNLLPVSIFFIWAFLDKWRFTFLQNLSLPYSVAELLNSVQKFKMVAVRHLELLFGYSGPPTKFFCWPEACVQIWCRSDLYLRRISDRTFRKFGLKCLFAPPKFTF